MRIRSKFPATCSLCRGFIAQGEEIEWAPGTKPAHVVCPEGVPTADVPPEGSKPRFVLAMEQAGRQVSLRAPICPRPEAKAHFVKLVVAYGVRQSKMDLPEQAEELVLSVGPEGQVMERALVRAGECVYYLRFNGGPWMDRAMNNVSGRDEIGWLLKWSAPVHMAVEGLRHS